MTAKENNQIQFVDTHTHLDNPAFVGEADEIVDRAIKAGVTKLITVGAGGGDGIASAERAVGLSAKYANVWATVGVHPLDASEPINIDVLTQLAAQPKVVAIGETGLDYLHDRAPRPQQEAWFRAQIALAIACKKPLVIHCREAGADCLRILIDARAERVGGVFHCFSESAAFAERLTELNFIVSFPGSLTFKNADALRSVAAAIPLDRIMLETDAPYMAPVPYRGGRSESAHVLIIAETLARIKNVSLEKVASQTTANARKLFNI